MTLQGRMNAASTRSQTVHWRLPRDIHRALKIRAAEAGSTIPAVAAAMLRRQLGLTGNGKEAAR